MARPGRRTTAALGALALTCALTAGAPPLATTTDTPGLVAETVGPDGATTSSYDDGSTFTFEAPGTTSSTASTTSLRLTSLASTRRSRDWSASYAGTVTSQYFHHDGGEVRLAVRPFTNCGTSQTVHLLVATSWGGYARSATASVPCGGGTVRWTTPEGNKKFQLVDPNTRDAYSPVGASGTVYWND
ncbi:hypothetical protein Q9R32_09095 [Actinotalea sp. AC32]|nr:hypothetical protein [Actinotalea sp. AC32]